jgi:hypothetical protein
MRHTQEAFLSLIHGYKQGCGDLQIDESYSMQEIFATVATKIQGRCVDVMVELTGSFIYLLLL